LLAHLRAALNAPALAYAEAPARISGGFETSIFRFRLAGASAALSGPLILRVLRPFRDPTQIRIEAAVQNALAAQGYLAPRVMLVETDVAVLGGAFLVMERLEGRPLAEGVDELVAGGGIGRTLRLLAEIPRTLDRIATVWADCQADLHALPVEPVLRAIEAAGLPSSLVTVDGVLVSLDRAIDRLGLTGLRAVHDWLAGHRPPVPAALSVCHCDFHPLNILSDGGRATGVIDWGSVMVGDAALDVGGTLANLGTVPVGGSGPLRHLARGLVRLALWRYRRAYARRRALDESAVRYYQVLRCLGHLVGAARAAGETGPAAGAHHSPAAQRLLIARIRALSGVSVTTVC
jgi:aminoglycoside phosphotransferase (APT) family kinase protein